MKNAKLKKLAAKKALGEPARKGAAPRPKHPGKADATKAVAAVSARTNSKALPKVSQERTAGAKKPIQQKTSRPKRASLRTAKAAVVPRRHPSRTVPKPRAAAVTRGVEPVTSAPTASAVTTLTDVQHLVAHKFDLPPIEKPQAFPTPPPDEALGELPEAYGTGRLFLTARDPHWLYAYWDLTLQQMADYRAQASDGRLVLHVFEKNHPHPIQELTLQHDTRNWYIPVPKPATTYSVRLGFWRHDGSFHVVSQSREVATPSESVSPDATARFVTIPIDIPFQELLGMIRSHIRDGEQLALALQRLQAEGFRFPFQVAVGLGPWSTEQAAALERILGGDILRRLQMGTFEISEWLRRRLLEQIASGMFSAFSPAGASWQAAPGKGFWFAINAELIVYGATEPGAKVTVDGKTVKLQSDGTFAFHYAFPDGQYRLPIVAVSAAGDDQRAVELSFTRKSVASGDVAKAKAASHLQTPAAT